MWQEFLSLFKAPVTGLKEVCEKESIKKVLIKLGVVSAVIAFLVLFRLLILNGATDVQALKIGAGVVFGMMFLSFVLFAGFIALVAVTILLIARALKVNISYKTALSLATNYSYVPAIASFLAFITSIFSLPLTIIIMLIGAMYYNLVLTIVVRNMLNVEKENKVFWISFGMKVGLFLVMVLVLWIASRIIGEENLARIPSLLYYKASNLSEYEKALNSIQSLIK